MPLTNGYHFLPDITEIFNSGRTIMTKRQDSFHVNIKKKRSVSFLEDGSQV